MKTSFELILRDKESIDKQIAFLKTTNFFDYINIPDILKFNNRSWDTVNILKNELPHSTIPHLRAIDFDIESKHFLKVIRGLKEILVIKGDPVNDPSRKVYSTSVEDMIKKIKSIDKSIIVYAAFDPYRDSLKNELRRMNSKLNAGADFLMSQPFFDTRLLSIYLENIDYTKLFIGISPVVSEKSKSYWENVNNVIFPPSFDCSYEWNISFAKDIIKLAKALDFNIYFMPIGIKYEKYFEFL